MVELFNFLDIDVFSLLVLAVIYMNFFNKNWQNDLQYRLFNTLILLNMALLSLDFISWILNTHLLFFISINYLLNALLIILTPFAPFIWLLYADYQVYKNELRIKKLFYLFLIPLSLESILILSSLYTKWIFYIDSHYVYHRGPLFFVNVLFSFLIMLYSFIFILMNKDKIEKKKFLPLLLFTIPSVIAGIIQSFVYGVSLTWSGMTIAILIIYLNIQDSRLKLDYLTGLYNRLSLDQYLETKIKNCKEKFAGVMIDLDDFKKTNDMYGHMAGDQLLITMADFLKTFFHKDDFVARFAGDEFVVIFDSDSHFSKTALIENMQSKLDEFNRKNEGRQKLSFSIGCAVFNPAIHQTPHHFYKDIDTLMYVEKNHKTER